MKTCTCVGTAPSWAGKDVLAVITGATRGFGACLAEQIVRVMCSNESTSPKSLHLFLIGRSQDRLLKTKASVEACERKGNTQLAVIVDPSLIIDFAHSTDAEMDKCINLIGDYANRFESNNELHLLFNNAGTVGNIDNKAHEHRSLSELDHYTRVNYSSMVAFTSHYLARIKPEARDNSCDNRLVCIVNISSLCALLPFMNMTEYCSMKAARTMFMRCLATDRSDISCFTYAPGPLETDMFESLKNMKNEEAAKKFHEMVDSGRVLDPNLSAQECISWLGFLSMPSEAKQGSLCHEHHHDILGIFTGSQLDYFDAKEYPNAFRIGQVKA